MPEINIGSQSLFNGLCYHVVVFGCQMNKHDSERVAGMLDALGAYPVNEAHLADIVIYMTCCVREAADVRLYGQVASLKNATKPPNLQQRLIAIGGCIGQRDGEVLATKLPHVNVVFGTHNIAHLPQLLATALEKKSPVIEVLQDPCDNDACANDLEQDDAKKDGNDHYSTNVRREQRFHAWLSIMTGCNNFCTYCIVPYVRGRERSRELDSIIAESKALVKDGVREITLLGQNVNSYGRDLYGQPRFADVLRSVAATGIERIRFATSHPKDLNDDTIDAFAKLDAVMPALHLPVQSGSDNILKAMNRNYTREHYIKLVEKLRAACKSAGKCEPAFSTDIIVGFPGETEADFNATLELVRHIGYAQVFTFIYSRREGTAAAALDTEIPRSIVQERFDRLVNIVQNCAWQCNQAELETVVDVLFEGESKRDSTMLSGRSPKNQTVHVQLPSGKSKTDYIGKILPVHIKEARTWYLRGTFLN
ncbi:MAG: tRNA (N6-isopentenyl adenosine(37)-C2)-methylthiotransferase MiaB [Coriobacteriales bacterium]|jgi:tRNA-2-methylthio-N6-dimethylallyladenosine synthase|nr:tRNA (N6-isopentenyl adenosine(37)-C2)-methylthiotransferase MiaB [Coriobacteriales bacterium]